MQPDRGRGPGPAGRPPAAGVRAAGDRTGTGSGRVGPGSSWSPPRISSRPGRPRRRAPPGPARPGRRRGDWPSGTTTTRAPLRPGPGLRAARPAARGVCHAGSVSKLLAPTLRLGWLLVPPRLMDSGERERHLRFVRRRHRRRRDGMFRAVDGLLPRVRVRVHGAAAGLHLMVTFDGADFEDADLASAALAGPARPGPRLRGGLRGRDRGGHRHPGHGPEEGPGRAAGNRSESFSGTAATSRGVARRAGVKGVVPRPRPDRGDPP